MTRRLASRLLAVALLAAALYPAIDHQVQKLRVRDRVDGLKIWSANTPRNLAQTYSPDPALLVRVAELGPLLAGWQTIGGCGAGSGTGGGAGLKWIGRGASGGLFNIQSQATYTRIHNAGKLEQHFFVNTLITRDVTEKWVAGANVPFVYKYLTDYYTPSAFDPSMNVDVSNGGLGDASVQATRKFGRINDTTLTAVVGLPTGTYDARFRQGAYLLQQQQLGFGMPTGTLVLDHTMDEIWGVVVLGGVGSWRGGQNKIDNYRAPSATTYAYTGYFFGPLVPAVGLSATGYTGHDRDRTAVQATPLFSLAGSFTLEWSTDWIALLAGASIPYQYVGTLEGGGTPPPTRSWGPWTVALGVSLSPF